MKTGSPHIRMMQHGLGALTCNPLRSRKAIVIGKPVDLDGFLKVIHSIDNFWLSVVKLPPGAGS